MKKIIICVALYTLSFASNGIEAMDGYYSNDLLGAVDVAREKPHHYDYSNTYRYKRTTAQSINLNRIDLDELENTRLDMTTTGINNNENDMVEPHPKTKIVQSDTRLKLNSSRTNTSFISTKFILQNIGVAYSTNGATSSTGVSSQTTVISTPRP